MDPLTLTSLAFMLVTKGIPLAQSIIDAVHTEIALVQSGTAPTADQQASIDAALDAAHAALQAA